MSAVVDSMIGKFLAHRLDEWRRDDPSSPVPDALAAVLRLHVPVDGMGYTVGGYGGKSPVCDTCGVPDEYGVDWPCETVRLLAGMWGYHHDYDSAWAVES